MENASPGGQGRLNGRVALIKRLACALLLEWPARLVRSAAPAGRIAYLSARALTFGGAGRAGPRG